MMQLKDRLFLLFSLVVIFFSSAILTYNVLCLIEEYNDNKIEEYEEVTQFEIAEQKSVITEPVLPAGGVMPLLAGDPDALDWASAQIKNRPIIIEEEEIPLTEQANFINNLTDEEIDLICRIAYKEAGNQCEDGKRAVIEVIINRVMQEKFPDTVYGVLSASGQFSTWARKDEVSQENIDKMKEILYIVRDAQESAFVKYIEEAELDASPEDYVYFARDKQSYHNNAIRIEDHSFGTR